MLYYTCPECNQKGTSWNWCKRCNSKHFQNDFNNWTSENDKIDKLIQDAQLNANYKWEVIEWISYDRFKDVKQIGKGGFGTIYYARWIDGFIGEWDIENQQWKRWGENSEVALKKFDNFVNFNDVLNEMEIHLKICIDINDTTSIKFYGITQDPETHSYMMILEYAKNGNLREYLKINFNNINWKLKLEHLCNLSLNLRNIHELDVVHQDFHPGNILSSSFKYKAIQISDFGLSKLIGANPNNPEKKNIVGVLPYVSPEVLSGDEEYTKAADVYSFGIIAYGYKNDYEVLGCSKAEEFLTNQESTNTTTTKTAIPLNYQTHPQAIYTSRLLNFSNLPKPKNEENFERELEELTKSMSNLCPTIELDDAHFFNVGYKN
ncbi:hypothetical protein Glove_15g20 [Diversispora epigaea]|uniref:Protein kinase domain-containing protein n=1 Tax=Diversispora epigaea TaxID=1348612 RepID=A0A397JNZ6_9GLOM|nr:hypothetical protein Glove_15g20 [Diversispora epigaea]